jgi:hypothetical protein
MNYLNSKLVCIPGMSSMLPLIILLLFAACKQNSEDEALSLDPAGKSAVTSASVAALAQPLPGDKNRFSWVTGNFDNSGYSWVRISNLTFDGNAGTVGATVWIWRSDAPKGKTAFINHRCSLRGHTNWCNTYTPTGWGYPAGQYTSWGGNYTYNSGTGVLSISWTTGAAAGGNESWQISNPNSTLARATAISSTYATTHGRGYGSKAAWNVYKTVSGTGFPAYTNTYSKSVSAIHTCSTCPATLSAGASAGQYIPSALSLAGFSTATGVTAPAQVAQYDLPGYVCSASSCSVPNVTGKIYHISSLGTSRAMVWNMFCACLVQVWPCYSGSLHPYAVQQIIDDNGNLVAMLGLEAQADTGTASLLAIHDWNNIP